MKDREVDPQRLGALLDGRLPTRERDDLLAELAASDDAIDLLSDVAAVLREVEPPVEASADGLVPSAPGPALAVSRGAEPPGARRRRPTFVRWMAVAASIAVMVSVPTLLIRSRDRGTVSTGTTRPSEALPGGWDGAPWRATRGEGDPLTPDARAVRAGARLTDLEHLARAGDARTADVAAEVAALLHDLPGGGLGVAALDALRESTTGGRPASPERLAAVRGAADAVFGAELTALGAWLESARLAAARRDAAFFRSDESRAALGRGRGAGAMQPLAPDVAARVARHLDRSGAPDWGPLQQELTTILRTLGS